ncbi:hypothetical protein Rsub_12477 [Raphidocelis subcapitata]|uniref:Uncharacterized protein n=1 Tax=Raphidocelis subcapitata TaxID=307507 RepID=A0A2V0PIM8_9CHLO|nr:hypothetical protein Rsub_12477 [Raphidocelis subcapitata]|eukprot:GBF99658.1 hypothetical protein Rsub_12477 [Raphidocelis subcapitata]
MRLAIIVLLALAGSAAARKPGTVTVAARPSLSLPSNRPPLWPFRTYADAKGWSCSMNPNGALVLEVRQRRAGRSGRAAELSARSSTRTSLV